MFNNEKITKEMILKGLEEGVIKLINNTNDNDIAAQIKKHWFYFASQTPNADLSVEEFIGIYDNDEIAELIYEAINDEPIKGKTEDDSTEWLYYKSVLLENLVA